MLVKFLWHWSNNYVSFLRKSLLYFIIHRRPLLQPSTFSARCNTLHEVREIIKVLLYIITCMYVLVGGKNSFLGKFYLI